MNLFTTPLAFIALNCKVLKFLALSLLACLPLATSASCLTPTKLTGVNLAGAEFNSKKLPGVANRDYTYPGHAELTYIAAQGANVIRLPFRWERIQHTAYGPLNAGELERLRNTINAAKNEGLCVVLDVHNYAKYFGETLGNNNQLQTAFIDLWLRLADEFKDPHSTAFGLMNEPAYMPLPEWASLAKRTLEALRTANAKNLIFIGGGHWSGLHDWFVVRDGHSNATAFANLTDPLGRIALEVHQYADAYYSGSKTDCLAPDHFDKRFSRITNWARDNNQQLFLGEFGVAQNENCLQVLERLLSLMNDTVWKGFTYWAAGRWWGDYPMALNTSTRSPSPQWEILKKYFYSTESSKPASRPKPPKTQRD